jgi:RHS repeat-associated protein
VAVTNASGALLSQQRYLPFGEVRTDVGTVSETDLGYTGQRALGDLGLMDYHARFYDAAIGRFAQPDSIIPSTEDPQSFNRFSYVIDNPLMYTDPTGQVNQYRCNYRKNPRCNPPSIASGGNNNSGGSGSNEDDDEYEENNIWDVPYWENGITADNQNIFGNMTEGIISGTGNGIAGRTDGGAGGLISDIFSAFNWSISTPQISLYHSSFTDYEEVSSQIGITYANGSPLTIQIYPPNLRNTFLKDNNNLSLNYTVNDPTIGYGQSLLGKGLSSLSGFNLNPINGAITSRLLFSYGPWTYNQSLTVKATFYPAETLALMAGKAAVVSGVLAFYLAPVSVPAISTGGVVYGICKTARACP